MKNIKTKTAFTLIELLIVLGIVVVVVGISFSSLTRSQSFQVFNNNFEKIFSLISNARSLAISGKGQLDYTDFDSDTLNHLSSPADYVTPANYGIRLNNTAGSTNITLFSDTNPPSSGGGQKGVYNYGTNYVGGDDLDLETLKLPNTLSLEIEDASSIKNTGSMFFSPNYADISFDEIDANPFLVIRLKENAPGNLCRQIRIHKLAGIPEVQTCLAY
jgi:prepilin-type N-terminal cleavage/methylation domain-containing protein